MKAVRFTALVGTALLLFQWGSAAHAQAPIIVALDMDPTGNACPGDGVNDCTLGSIDSCVSVVAGDSFTFDIVVDRLPHHYAGEGQTAFDTQLAWGPLVVPAEADVIDITARTAISPTIHYLQQAADSAASLNDPQALPRLAPPYVASVSDSEADEPDPVRGTAWRGALTLDAGAANGFYKLEFNPTTVAIANAVGYDECQDPGPGCTLQNAIIAVGMPCPEAPTATATATPSPTVPPTPTPTPPQACPQEWTPDANTAGLWHFNESGGTQAADSSANGYHGTVNGGANFVPGAFGNAIALDGVDDYVNMGNQPGLSVGTGDWTIEACVKTTAAPPDAMMRIAAKDVPDTGPGYMIAITHLTHTANCSVRDFNPAMTDPDWIENLDGTTPLNDDYWHHIRCQRAGSILQLYVDGALEAQASILPTLGTLDNTKPFVVGVRVDPPGSVGNPHFFSGLIDEVRLSNVARAAPAVGGVVHLQPVPSALTAHGPNSPALAWVALAGGAAAFALAAGAWYATRRWVS